MRQTLPLSLSPHRSLARLPAYGILSAIVAFTVVSVRAETPAEWAQGENLEHLVTLYQHFHSHPELSMQEKETAARLAKELEGAGAKVTRNVGGHGVVAVVENGPGK